MGWGDRSGPRQSRCGWTPDRSTCSGDGTGRSEGRIADGRCARIACRSTSRCFGRIARPRVRAGEVGNRRDPRGAQRLGDLGLEDFGLLSPGATRDGGTGGHSHRRGAAPAQIHVRRLGRRTILVGAVVAVGAVLGSTSATARAATPLRGLTVGISGDDALVDADPGTESLRARRAAAEGVRLVRVDITWSNVAPDPRPPGFNPSDPGSPGYDWRLPDAAIRAASAAGLQVLVMIYSAPSWAEGPIEPHGSGRPAGVWEPELGQYSAFATAAARRYSGTFPDPKLHPGRSAAACRATGRAGTSPNLGYYLSPQWTQTSHGYVPASPAIYRGLQNAFYGAVKAVNPSELRTSTPAPPRTATRPATRGCAPLVVLPQPVLPQPQPALGLCPAAGVPRRRRRPPVRDLGSDRPRPRTRQRDRSRRLQGPEGGQAAGVRHGSRPAAPLQASCGSTSSPGTRRRRAPSSIAHPLGIQAQWCEQAMYELWRQGASMIMWLQLRDMPSTPRLPLRVPLERDVLLRRQAEAVCDRRQVPVVTTRRNHTQIARGGRAPRERRAEDLAPVALRQVVGREADQGPHPRGILDHARNARPGNPAGSSGGQEKPAMEPVALTPRGHAA